MKHNILKSLFISVILLAGTSNVWAWDNAWNGGSFSVYMPGWTAGFDTSKEQEVTFNINGQNTTLTSPYDKAGSDRDLTQSKIESSLKITGYKVYMYHKNKDGGQEQNGANIHSSELSWNIYNPQGTNVGTGTCNGAWISEDNWKNNQQDQRWGASNQNYNLLSNVVAKTNEDTKYTIDFWFKATSKWTNSSNTEWSNLCTIWYPGNSQNFKYQFTIPKTTLTLQASAGSPSLSSGITGTVALNQEYTLTAPAMTGYEFSNWTTSDAHITITNATSSTGATVKFASFKSATITANYTPITYAINYTAPTNGTYTIKVGSKAAVSANTTANYKEIITLANTPNKGYLFDKWTITPTVSITNSRTFSMPANDVTIAATFTLEEYTITYHNIDGATHTNPANYTVETPTITLQAPTKELYTFEGWYQQADFSGDKVTQITEGTTGNIDLYAKWSETKYSVNIYTNNSHYGITTPSGANWVGPTPVEITATPHNGYHFTEWTATGGATIANTTSDTTFVTATSIGTVIAHFVESLYDITVQASNNAHGKVTQSATQAGISTAITITADPMEGYEFTGWSKDGDITIASINSATTTLTATGAGTVTANFAPKGSTPIYFRANSGWKTDNARFAVYYNKIDNTKGWSELFEICGGDYYHADAPAECKELKIRRLKPKGSTGYQDVNDGLNNSNIWSETDFVPMPTDGKTMYDMTKIYLRPNGNWKSDGARFAVYFFDGTSGTKWVSMSPTTTDGLYYCDIPEGNYKQVNFCRMNPSNTTNDWTNRWNQTKDLTLLFNTNCFTINEGDWGGDPKKQNDPGADGQWSLVNDEATYDVTLYSCSFGEYGFIYNNVEYTSPQSGNITYQVPVNATVKVFSRPYSKEYRGDVMVNQSGTKWEITPDNPLLNITCHTVLDDNYKTTGEHEVYLAIPNNGGTWVKNEASLHYLYAFHDRTELGRGIPVQMTEVGHANVELNPQNVDHIYYRCVIPAEVNTIRFEKRSDATTTVLSTIDLRYDIPLNSVNCYRLDRKGNSNQSYAGIWEASPGFGGDFRLVHYRAENDIYYSDIIRHGTISQVVSLHIYTVNANAEYPKLELQQQNANGEWVTVSGQTKLVKDINRIMNDKQDQGCGVWNFTITTDGADHATVNFSTPQRYTGNYYIRTNNAEGEWRNYTLSTNHMTFSSYAKNHSGYTHYYCRYIDLIDDSKVPGHNKNVKFIIANDHATVLSNELAGDSHTTSGGDLPESANVRWTWNEVTNEVARAYILGSHGTTDHIVAKNSRLNTPNRLNDQEDWVYEIDMEQVKQGDKLNIHATYPSQKINNVNPVTQTFADNLEMIKTDASNQNSYTVRVMYDFKINKTLIMLLPDQADPANIGVDVLIDRTDQGEATQVQSTVTSNEGYTVYSTLTLTKDHLLGNGTEWARLYYWISFPFDVRISEIFGFGEYGKHYIIQYYDGAARAENGCWADSPTYWRQIQITDTTYSARRENEDEYGNPQNGILVANKGYVLALARNIANSNIFKHGNEYVRLYFPSREKIKSIDGNMQNTTVYLRPHTCTIEREDRNIYDSNWHIIGVPSYADKTQTLAQDNLLYFYTYNTADNTYAPTSAQGATVQFNSMHAYMVQFAGNINWQSWTLTQEPQSVVARRQSAEAQENYSLRLELQRDGQYADQTFIQLQAEGATTDYDINQDLTKIINTGANIYTLAGEKHIQLAGNVLPSAKTTIPVGVQVPQAGTYTFALPDGTSGISATLVDNLSGIHTNLLLDGYTVTLDAGATEGRFYIVLDPDRTATAVENIDDEANTTQKYLIDGQLIIRTSQGVYNAIGNTISNIQ